MTKLDIVIEISNKTNIDRVAVQQTIELFMDTIKKAMSDGQTVSLRGFGTFVVKQRCERKARNISKNSTIVIPPKCVPTFKPSKFFKNKIK